jgi:hypothetical protein
MTVRTLRITSFAAAALGAVALPAAALAAPVPTHPLRGCYVSVDPSAREVVNVKAAGFTPLATVSTFVDGVDQGHTFDVHANGTVFAKAQAPYIGRGERPFSVTVAEKGNPANTLTLASRVTALKVTLTPRSAETSSRVRISGRGFTRARPIWGHYVFRGRARRTVRFADGPATACGTFSVRRRQIPIKRPRPGRWTLQVDQQRRYSGSTRGIYLRVPITVRRTIG